MDFARPFHSTSLSSSAISSLVRRFPNRRVCGGRVCGDRHSSVFPANESSFRLPSIGSPSVACLLACVVYQWAARARARGRLLLTSFKRPLISYVRAASDQPPEPHTIEAADVRGLNRVRPFGADPARAGGLTSEARTFDACARIREFSDKPGASACVTWTFDFSPLIITQYLGSLKFRNGGNVNLTSPDHFAPLASSLLQTC